jgi:hypothetical protein
VVLRDNDGKDCIALKQRLRDMCVNAGRADTLVRLVCQELEAWFLGDLEAIEEAYVIPDLAAQNRGKARFRNPDELPRPSQDLADLTGDITKIERARRIAKKMVVERNTSPSFQVFVSGVSQLLTPR